MELVTYSIQALTKKQQHRIVDDKQTNRSIHLAKSVETKSFQNIRHIS
jgi:hypothetical protein